MKKLFLIPIFVFLVGCSALEEADRKSQERQSKANLETRCLNGVTYYFTRAYSGYNGFGYMAPKFNPDGSLEICD